MTVVAKRRQHMIVGISSCGPKRIHHPSREFRSKVSVVLAIDHDDWNARGAAEFSSSFDQLIRDTVVVGFALHTTTAAGSKRNDRPHRFRILTAERNRPPASPGLPDNDDIIALDERLR